MMFFFYKQKTAYEMRISDWSSDVCSSDLSQDTTSTQDTTNRKDQPEGSQRARSTDAIDLDAVVVTGTSGTRTRMQESVSTSVIGIESIQNSAPRSTAEIFRNIPGIRSEASGGEGNANIAVRGLPVASGGAKFLQLQEARKSGV